MIDGDCYRMTKKSKAMSTVMSECGTLGGYLASFDDFEHYDAVVSAGVSYGWFGSSGFWTGGMLEDGEYKWQGGPMDGDVIVDEVWEGGMAHELINNQQCVLGGFAEGGLDSGNCKLSRYGLCQSW